MSAALLALALWAEPSATTTVEEEVDLGALEEAAPSTERERSPWLLVLPALTAGLLLWNTELRRTSR